MLNSNFKLLFINFLILFNLQAFEITKENLFTSMYISINEENFIDAKDLNYDFFEKKHSKITLKININKANLEDKQYYLKVTTLPKYFIKADVPYTLKNDLAIIRINKDTKKTITFDFNFKKSVPFFNFSIYNEFEHKYIMNEEKILFGIAYGILFCAFLYNFVFYLYNKEKSFLYYSFLQIALIFTLLPASGIQLVYKILEEYGSVAEYILISLLHIVFFISILFNIEFLNIKKYSPKINKFLWFLAYFILIDLIILHFNKTSIIDDFIPTFVIIFILILSAIFVLFKGYKPAIFYIIGWITLFIFVFLAETDLVEFSQVYLLHIGIPLESLLFSFALGFKTRQVELEKQQNERLLINQSKLASMGEMIGNIAHQWRQPLTHLSYTIMNIQASYETDKLNKQYLEEKVTQANDQIEFMSHTIDDFRNFFKVSKQKEVFNLVTCIGESITLLNDSFKSLGIELKFDYENDLLIQTYKGELSQVIFNLLNNAKDEFIRKEIENPKINIQLLEEDKGNVIKISDNAGGIKNDILKKIFEPYFTTKDKGLGIGLYMSKMIIEKNIGGKLEVDNIENGASFKISLHITKKLT